MGKARRKVLHITLREGLYQYRRRVPPHAQARLGGMWNRSLGTADLNAALALRAAAEQEFWAAVNETPAQLARKELAQQGIDASVSDRGTREILRDLVGAITADLEGPTPTIRLTLDVAVDGPADAAILDAARQRALQQQFEQFAPDDADDGARPEWLGPPSEITIPTAQPPTARSVPPEAIRAGPNFREVASEHGIDPDRAPTRPHEFLARLGPQPETSAAQLPSGQPASSTATAEPRRTVRWLVEQRLAYEPVAWSTEQEWKLAARRFAGIVGDRDVGDVALDVQAAFRFADLVKQLPNRMPVADRQLSMEQIVEKYRESDVERLSQDSIKKQIGGLATVFAWAARRQMIPGNPFVNVKAEARATKSGSRTERVPYSLEELVTVFSSPIYTEGFRPDSAGGEAHFWIPLLALGTGARLNEIGQMDVTDVVQIGDTFILSIVDEGRKTRRKAPGEKSTKTEASKRRVPLNDVIAAIGFGKYVAWVKSQGHKKLFPELKVRNENRKITANYSKFWGRWRKDVLKITSRETVFHSFRHGVKRATLHAGIDEELRKAFLGHASSDPHSDYGAIKKDMILMAKAGRGALPEGLDLSHLRWEPPPG